MCAHRAACVLDMAYRASVSESHHQHQLKSAVLQLEELSPSVTVDVERHKDGCEWLLLAHQSSSWLRYGHALCRALQGELSRVLYPVFLHCYFRLVANDAAPLAKELLAK